MAKCSELLQQELLNQGEELSAGEIRYKAKAAGGYVVKYTTKWKKESSHSDNKTLRKRFMKWLPGSKKSSRRKHGKHDHNDTYAQLDPRDISHPVYLRLWDEAMFPGDEAIYMHPSDHDTAEDDEGIYMYPDGPSETSESPEQPRPESSQDIPSVSDPVHCRRKSCPSDKERNVYAQLDPDDISNSVYFPFLGRCRDCGSCLTKSNASTPKDDRANFDESRNKKIFFDSNVENAQTDNDHDDQLTLEHHFLTIDHFSDSSDSEQLTPDETSEAEDEDLERLYNFYLHFSCTIDDGIRGELSPTCSSPIQSLQASSDIYPETRMIRTSEKLPNIDLEEKYIRHDMSMHKMHLLTSEPVFQTNIPREIKIYSDLDQLEQDQVKVTLRNSTFKHRKQSIDSDEQGSLLLCPDDDRKAHLLSFYDELHNQHPKPPPPSDVTAKPCSSRFHDCIQFCDSSTTDSFDSDSDACMMDRVDYLIQLNEDIKNKCGNYCTWSHKWSQNNDYANIQPDISPTDSFDLDLDLDRTSWLHSSQNTDYQRKGNTKPDVIDVQELCSSISKINIDTYLLD